MVLPVLLLRRLELHLNDVPPWQGEPFVSQDVPGGLEWVLQASMTHIDQVCQCINTTVVVECLPFPENVLALRFSADEL